MKQTPPRILGLGSDGMTDGGLTVYSHDHACNGTNPDNPVFGRLMLDPWLPPSGTSVALTSSNPAVASVPASVLIERPCCPVLDQFSFGSPEYTTRSLPSGTRFWRVRPYDDAFVPGPWSAVRTLTVTEDARSGGPAGPLTRTFGRTASSSGGPRNSKRASERRSR